MQQLVDTAGRAAHAPQRSEADDFAEYRPRPVAAGERRVRHPYVELGIGKGQIYALSRGLSLGFAELPASPCLASRLYLGS
ncbi:MAG: hypothetical protein M3P93_11595 [Actinomycetota bacterium]|jgi:uncharacterized protein|nr:hypothetical protein [Actinomycetota bacterium]